ncbi:MAG: hypothetical protein N2316_11370, partial [Spirochaetes bacterium]|nr:hypothetical protein [Spirochaetota bacterium]
MGGNLVKYCKTLTFLLFAISIHWNLFLASGAFAQQSNLSVHNIFLSTPEEDVTPTKWEIGNTIISNEDRLELYKKHIEDIGGGYIGVGGTQNFLLASWANSEWVWLCLLYTSP